MIEVQVMGDSMTPEINSGERICFSTDKVPDVGDVVLFKCNGELTAHRLLPGFILKGDNSKYCDGMLNEDFEVLGVASNNYRKPFLARISKYNDHKIPFSKLFRALIIITHLFQIHLFKK